MTRSSPLSSKFDNLFARKLRDKILKKKEIFFFFFFLNKITSKSRIVFQNIFVFDAFLFLFRQHCIFAFLFFFLFLAILFLVFNFILFFFFFFFHFLPPVFTPNSIAQNVYLYCVFGFFITLYFVSFIQKVWLMLNHSTR